MDSIYEVPLGFANEGVDELILKYLHKDAPEGDLPAGRILSTAVTTPRTRSPSPLSASMWSTKTATRA